MASFFLVGAAIVVLLTLAFRAVTRRPGRRRYGGPGPGASGAIYDMLNEDKRKAIEIIVEGRAEYRDPEHADDVPKDEPRSYP